VEIASDTVVSLLNNSATEPILIRTDNGNTNQTWEFGASGNLTLPRGGVVYETNIPYGGLSGNTIALLPQGGTSADQQLLIYPTVGADANHLHLTSGNLYNTELFLGNDDLYVKLANTGNIVINSNDNTGNTAQWTFGTTGNLTVPGNIIMVPGTSLRGSGASPAPSINGFSSVSAETLSATGNVSAVGNITAGNISTGSGSITGGNVNGNVFNGNVAFGNGVIGGAGNISGGNISAIGNITGGNISASGNISAGNIGVSERVTCQSVVTDPVNLGSLTAVFGARGFILDGNLAAAGNFGAQVSGNGSNAVPVWSDGANWYIG
jgi:hypothetical protein